MMIIKIKRQGPGAEAREAADKIFKANKEAAAKKAHADAEQEGRATAPPKRKGKK